MTNLIAVDLMDDEHLFWLVQLGYRLCTIQDLKEKWTQGDIDRFVIAVRSIYKSDDRVRRWIDRVRATRKSIMRE